MRNTIHITEWTKEKKITQGTFRAEESLKRRSLTKMRWLESWRPTKALTKNSKSRMTPSPSISKSTSYRRRLGQTSKTRKKSRNLHPKKATTRLQIRTVIPKSLAKPRRWRSKSPNMKRTISLITSRTRLRMFGQSKIEEGTEEDITEGIEGIREEEGKPGVGTEEIEEETGTREIRLRLITRIEEATIIITRPIIGEVIMMAITEAEVEEAIKILNHTKITTGTRKTETVTKTSRRRSRTLSETPTIQIITRRTRTPLKSRRRTHFMTATLNLSMMIWEGDEEDLEDEEEEASEEEDLRGMKIETQRPLERRPRITNWITNH